MEMEAMLAVSSAVEAQGRIQSGVLPGGEAATFLHIGPYDQMMSSRVLIEEWMQEHRRESAAPGWEVYLNDPQAVGDPAKFETLLVQPLKAAK